MLSYWGVNDFPISLREHKVKYFVASVPLWDIRQLKIIIILV